MKEFTSQWEDLEQYSELLKALAHPVRLCIVRGLLREGSCNVSTMQQCLEIPQSTVSQHLGKLKAAGIIAGDRDGTEIYYRVVNKDANRIVNALF